MSSKKFDEGTTDPRINHELSPVGFSRTQASHFEPPPTSYETINETMEELVNKTGELRTDFIERPTKYNAQIFDLGDPNYSLLQPILISVENYAIDDSYIASFPEIEVFGEGTNESEAIGNLKYSILDLFDELNELEISELGDLPKTWLRILNNIIKENIE